MVKIPTDYSLDLRVILYENDSNTTNTDVYALRMPERESFRVLDSEANEQQGRLSPNGRWIHIGRNRNR